MISKIQTKLYFISLSIFIVLIDQFTKYLIFYNKKLFINNDFLFFKWLIGLIINNRGKSIKK